MKKNIRGQARAVIAIAAALVASVGIAAPANALALDGSAEQTCYYNLDTGAYYCAEAVVSLSGKAKATIGGLAVAAASTASVVARMYENTNYSGTSLVFTTTVDDGCAGGYSKTGNMPDGWNDRVSSFTTATSGRIRLGAASGRLKRRTEVSTSAFDSPCGTWKIAPTG